MIVEPTRDFIEIVTTSRRSFALGLKKPWPRRRDAKKGMEAGRRRRNKQRRENTRDTAYGCTGSNVNKVGTYVNTRGVTSYGLSEPTELVYEDKRVRACPSITSVFSSRFPMNFLSEHPYLRLSPVSFNFGKTSVFSLSLGGQY